MALEEDLDALYGASPGEFLDRRKALAQALRKAGNKDEAAEIAGAAKPTAAAWAVNQLARKHPADMAALMKIGERLRGLLRASFAGRGDAGAMAEAKAEQREAVGRLTRAASKLLEEAGVSSSATVLERAGITLTTISTIGGWGDSAPGRLTRDLDPPGIEALASLVGEEPSAEPKAPARPSKLEPSRKEEAPRREGLTRKEESARRAAELARERVQRAESALEVATAAEERARAAVERAKAAAVLATSTRTEREAAAREARRDAKAQEEAAAEARRKAEAAAVAARAAEDAATGAARAETAAKSELAEAEKALSRAAAESISAEEAVVRERRKAPVESG